jgi:hypothetical protein
VVAGDAAAMSLTAQQCQALELIASGPRGCTKGLLLADGFAADMLADLVREGLATAQRGAVRVAGREIRVERCRIADAGRKALKGRETTTRSPRSRPPRHRLRWIIVAKHDAVRSN